MSDVVRISMWSGPRNISTTMMYSFAQRADTVVVDEPLYAAYLHSLPDLDHPGRDEVLAAQDTDHRRVIDAMLHDPAGPVRMYKNMGHHLHGVDDREFLLAMRNVVLTRAPAPVIRSLSRHLPRPTLRDVGYGYLVEIVEFLAAHGRDPVVVVADDVLADPEGMLRALCDRLGIGWDPAMLSWTPGPRPEDGVWARWWYENVHRSAGFGPPRPHDPTVAPEHEALLAEAEPLHHRLLEHRLRPAAG